MERLSKKLVGGNNYDQELLEYNLKKSRSILQKKIVSDRYSTKEKIYQKTLSDINYKLGLILAKVSAQKNPQIYTSIMVKLFMPQVIMKKASMSIKKPMVLRKRKKYLDGMMAVFQK